MARRSFFKSPCCGESVVVPVDVTMHQLVLANGELAMETAHRIVAIDDMRSLRRQAAGGAASINEAYCWGCGKAVDVPRAEREPADDEDAE